MLRSECWKDLLPQNFLLAWWLWLPLCSPSSVLLVGHLPGWLCSVGGNWGTPISLDRIKKDFLLQRYEGLIGGVIYSVLSWVVGIFLVHVCVCYPWGVKSSRGVLERHFLLSLCFKCLCCYFSICDPVGTFGLWNVGLDVGICKSFAKVFVFRHIRMHSEPHASQYLGQQNSFIVSKQSTYKSIKNLNNQLIIFKLT